MPLSDDIFAASSNPAVPGGSFAKPLILALLALLAARKFGGGGGAKADKEEMPDFSLPGKKDAAADETPDTVSGGLGELVDQFRKTGLGDAIDSWVGPGENKNVQTKEVGNALGGDMVDELAKRTGLSRDQVLDGLAQVLPGAVDKMTPDGRVPTAQDLFRLMS